MRATCILKSILTDVYSSLPVSYQLGLSQLPKNQ